MTMRPLFEKLSHNLPAKILCFLLAVFIYVLFQFSTVTRKSFALPLAVQELGDFTPTVSIMDNVKVTVRGSNENISQLLGEDFYPYLDLSYYSKPGIYRVPVQVRLSPRAVELNPLEVQTSPPYVSVSIEQRVKKQVPLTPIFVGAPHENYFLDSFEINPKYIEIEGPRSIVESKEELVTLPIVLDDITSNFVIETNVDNSNRLLSINTLTPIYVSVLVAEETVNSSYTDIPIRFENIPDGYTASLDEHLDTLTPLQKTASVTVTIPKSLYNSYVPPTFTGLIDCSEITQEGVYELPVHIQSLDGFTVISVTPETMTVFVVEKDS